MTASSADGSGAREEIRAALAAELTRPAMTVTRALPATTGVGHYPMVSSATVVGVYPVDAPEPCHLVELLVTDNDGVFDLGAITQPDPAVAQPDWQVPWAEKLLSPDGDQVAWDFWEGTPDDAMWQGTVRLVFFLHYLSQDQPLRTPFGDLSLPEAQERPARLAAIQYEEP